MLLIVISDARLSKITVSLDEFDDVDAVDSTLASRDKRFAFNDDGGAFVGVLVAEVREPRVDASAVEEEDVSVLVEELSLSNLLLSVSVPVPIPLVIGVLSKANVAVDSFVI